MFPDEEPQLREGKEGRPGKAPCSEVLDPLSPYEAQGHLCRREKFNLVLASADTASCLGL